MHAFDVLGDPVRGRILELLAEGEHSVHSSAVRMRDEAVELEAGLEDVARGRVKLAITEALTCEFAARWRR